uniref:xylan glycosyltransferase MUCI21-like n=1 Tax=Erigeron canadensis TaxID=72917 RepID=UPI001CB8DDA2|nr:xylan glycosyltransferase MUCI21-like [Erigeron canadensis]
MNSKYMHQKMVQKETTRPCKTEKQGRGGRLVLFATQTLCALFLFRLLYTEITFKGTPNSQQIKLDILVASERQILSESKRDESITVKKEAVIVARKNVSSGDVKKDVGVAIRKDDHNQSIQYLLTRLVGGEDRTKLESTGFACDNTSWSIICVTNKPVQIDMSTLQVYLETSPTTENTTTVLRPYSMQENPYVMKYITPVTITTTKPSRPATTCDHIHQHPAVIFSTGGYTGNLFHEFNENIIPLFITTRLFKSRVHFVVVDHKPSFIRKYRKIFPHLSSHEIINTAVDKNVHCFPGAITGLKFHKFLGVNTSENPQNYYTMPDFREFIRLTYRLKTKNVFQTQNPPILLLISRQGTRKFLNQVDMVQMMERLGFRVIIASSDKEMSDIERFSRVINTCSVMVGAHGAGLANEIFLPDGAVMIQVRPLGFQYGVDAFYSEPCPGMGLKYLEYMIEPRESSLAEVYGLDHPIVADTASVAAKGGYAAAREIYLNNQDLRLNLNRFRETLVEALGFIGRHKNVDNAR